MFLPLGNHPPANAFLTREQLEKPEPVFPLDTYVCLDCGLILVTDQLPADFFVEYLYVPSGSATMKQHFSRFAETIKKRWLTSSSDLVVDIGCNDGLLLKACADLGIATLGVEPAANIAEMARAHGLKIVNEYFTDESSRDIRKKFGPAKVIVTTNTFNHIDDLHGFIRGVTGLLSDEGTLIVEVPQAIKYVEMNEFDTVYHEHLSTFSVTSLSRVFDFYGMTIADIEELPIHGGSMRVSARKGVQSDASAQLQESWVSREREARLFDRATYDALAARVETIRANLMALLDDLRAKGKRIAGYGAPAKGNTLLNYFGIGPDRLEFLADRNPLKHGRFSPGMHIPIVPPDRVTESRPDYLLILAWNFADEIIREQSEYRANGGKFIIPIPEPTIVE
jgi:hypothetical protein